MEQLLFLLVVGLIAFVRKLFMEGGLEKILGKLNTDLNRPSDELRRATPPPIRRDIPASLSPEEVRMRKFREALGLPATEEAHRKSGQSPVPPFLAQPVRASPAERARREHERIERKLAEKKRTLQPPVPPPVPVAQRNEEDSSVSKYFEMENFNQPPIQQDKIPENAPIIEADFFKILEKQELVAISPERRLSEIFGTGSDLRRLILAQEILGRPKSLQNA